MAVGASKPTVVADKDGFFSVKSKMMVSQLLNSFESCKCVFLNFSIMLI